MIAEEAQARGQHHVPTIQLLQFNEGQVNEGQAEGEVSIRFCYYNHLGRFQRSPLLMSMDEIEMMREALRETPKLRALLRKLTED